jgi:hypothetical protein
MKLRLTAVISNYNYGRFLPAAVEAMMHQSRPADELILIDDASTDGSQAVVDELARRFPAIKVVKHAVNRGMNPTGQEALELATGDYFYWGSADDMVLPGFFESAMTLLEQHPTAPLCAGVPVEWRVETGEQLRTARGMPDVACHFAPEALWPLARRGSLSLGGAWAVYRIADLKAAGGFRVPLRWLSDWFPIYALALSRGLCWTGQPSAVMRFHAQNYSGVGPQRRPEHHAALVDLARLAREMSPEVRTGFRASGMLGVFEFPMVSVLLGDRKNWSLLTPAFWRVALRTMGFRCVLTVARKLVPRRWRNALGRRTREQTQFDLSAMDSRGAT